MQTLSFQAPEEIKNRLDVYAKELERSKGYIIRKALEEYLDELEDYMEARAYKDSCNPKENIPFDKIKRKYNLDNSSNVAN